jgi:hypothetical protein
MNSKLRKAVAGLGLVAATVGVGAGIANAQTSTTATTAAATSNTKPARPANGQQGHPGQPGGPGFSAHAATIAKLLGMSTADLQTAMQTKSIAAIAKEKGVNVQTIIDAYVAEEKAEHPDMAAADVVKRVTDMVNGVRPSGPPNGQPGGPRGQRPGQTGTGTSGTSGSSSSTSTAKATVKA